MAYLPVFLMLNYSFHMLWFRAVHTGRQPKKKDQRNSHLSIIYIKLDLAVMGVGVGFELMSSPILDKGFLLNK